MVLLVLSSQSIHSEWVKTEVAKARKRELKKGRRMLFPYAISFTELQELGMLRPRHRQGLGPRNSRIL